MCPRQRTDMLQGQQYVCAGELVALQTLTNVLNYLKVKKVDIVQVCNPLITLCIKLTICYS